MRDRQIRGEVGQEEGEGEREGARGAQTPPGLRTSRGPTGDADTTQHTLQRAGGARCTNAITQPKSHCSIPVSSPLLLSKYLEERSE